jgi:hypothetical protein
MTTSGPAGFACSLGALVGLGLSTFAHYAVAGAHTPPSVGRAFPICLRDHSCEREDSIHASRNIGGPRAWLILYEREREMARIGTMRRLTSVKREAQA